MKTNLGVVALTMGVLAVAVGASTGCGDSGGSGGTGGTTSSSGSTGTSSSKASSGTGTGTATSTGTGMAQSCQTYCATIMANCTDANQQYTDMSTCVASCSHFPAGTAADTMGDTLGCRIYHAGAAAGAGADTHCEHAGPLGGGQCGTNECMGFCDIAVAACPTEWPSLDDCNTQCATIADTVPYNTMVTGGDSLACRMYHLQVATGTPNPHCTHTPAMPAPGTPCAG